MKITKTMSSRVSLTAAVSLVCVNASLGQSFTLPGSNDTAAGNAGSLIMFGGQIRTYQAQFSASLLTGLNVGDKLYSVRVRNTSSQVQANSPALSFANWKMQIGRGTNAISAMSSTYANNMTGVTTVKNGPLSFAAGAFQGGAGPSSVNPWGPEIVFDTPYTYTGGDLVIFVTHGGDQTQPAQSLFADALGSTATGYGTNFRALTTLGTQDATTASSTSSSVTIVRFSTRPVPEPATMTFMAIGLAGLVARKRKRQA